MLAVGEALIRRHTAICRREPLASPGDGPNRSPRLVSCVCSFETARFLISSRRVTRTGPALTAITGRAHFS
jgi:hypothetical protein